MLIPSRDRILKGLWWDRALTLVEGCTPIMQGCKNCWAAAATAMRQNQTNLKIKERYRGLTNKDGAFNGVVKPMYDALKIPYETKKPTVWAIWNDLFHHNVPLYFQHWAFNMFAACPQHHFIVCTKRPARMADVIRDGRHNEPGRPIDNVTLMASASTKIEAGLIYPKLLEIASFRLAASLEPLLEYIDIKPYAHRLSWVVTGCETGIGRRRIFTDEIEHLSQDCRRAGLPVFVKAAEINGKIKKMPLLESSKDRQGISLRTFYNEFPK